MRGARSRPGQDTRPARAHPGSRAVRGLGRLGGPAFLPGKALLFTVLNERTACVAEPAEVARHQNRVRRHHRNAAACRAPVRFAPQGAALAALRHSDGPACVTWACYTVTLNLLNFPDPRSTNSAPNRGPVGRKRAGSVTHADKTSAQIAAHGSKREYHGPSARGGLVSRLASALHPVLLL
jgi:hypothetical protein